MMSSQRLLGRSSWRRQKRMAARLSIEEEVDDDEDDELFCSALRFDQSIVAVIWPNFECEKMSSI